MVRKLGLLGSLYLAQGLPYGFFTQALPAMLRQQGVSLEGIGLASLLALPWGLKFLWAPAVDRLGWARIGRRRSWILPLQAAAVATLLGLSALDPRAQLEVVLAGVLLINLIAATQDIATDGLAVTILRPAERGLGNGVQVAGYRLGMIVGGGALLVVFERLGWATIFALMAGLLALASLPILGFREPPPPPAGPRVSAWAALRGFVARPGAGAWLAAIAAFKAGEHFATAMLKPLLIDRGLDLEAIGWLLGTAGFVASFVGALSGGALCGRLGRERALGIFGALQAVAVGAYALATVGPVDLRLLYGLTIAEHLVGGMATAALFTRMMDACRPEHAGSDYTAQASVVVLATGAASAASGASAAALGYTAHFVVAGAACAALLLPLGWHAALVRAGRSRVMGGAG